MKEGFCKIKKISKSEVNKVGKILIENVELDKPTHLIIDYKCKQPD